VALFGAGVTLGLRAAAAVSDAVRRIVAKAKAVAIVVVLIIINV
jgi:hypothetical protein